MGNKRRKFSNDFKARVAIEALKSHKTTAQIAAEHKLHPTQVTEWTWGGQPPCFLYLRGLENPHSIFLDTFFLVLIQLPESHRRGAPKEMASG